MNRRYERTPIDSEAASRSRRGDEPEAEEQQTRVEDLASVRPATEAELGGAELIVIAHPDPSRVGARLRLPHRPVVTLGRAGAADLRLEGSSSVSRIHARLRLEQGAATIEDAGSSNGTFLNGARITAPTPLASGDRFQIGGVHFKFLRERDVEAAFHDALQELAVRDGLTGAYNRRFFDDELEREMARARRHRRPFALILADVDRFKSVNDRHGHVVGDQVLRGVVEVLRGGLRAEQVVARVGGEELAVLCPESGAADAAALAERLRAALESHAMSCLPPGARVTCSFGVAELDRADAEPAELYARADRALYRSKEAGRNRVSIERTSTKLGEVQLE